MRSSVVLRNALLKIRVFALQLLVAGLGVEQYQVNFLLLLAQKQMLGLFTGQPLDSRVLVLSCKASICQKSATHNEQGVRACTAKRLGRRSNKA